MLIEAVYGAAIISTLSSPRVRYMLHDLVGYVGKQKYLHSALAVIEASIIEHPEDWVIENPTTDPNLKNEKCNTTLMKYHRHGYSGSYKLTLRVNGEDTILKGVWKRRLARLFKRYRQEAIRTSRIKHDKARAEAILVNFRPKLTAESEYWTRPF